MAAGEAGADYVMFGEPHRDGWTPPLAETAERVAWWAEIFETPCVAYAARLDDVATLAAAGADFVALGDALWSAPSLEQAIAAAEDAARQGGRGADGDARLKSAARSLLAIGLTFAVPAAAQTFTPAFTPPAVRRLRMDRRRTSPSPTISAAISSPLYARR